MIEDVRPELPGLVGLPAIEHPELLAAPVADALAGWPQRDQVTVVEIDPAIADTAALVDAYDLDITASVNCVLVAGSRAGDERVAACLIPAHTRADVNRVVRRLLDVRKCSFLPQERAVAESGMEYGGITALGLPAHWRVLVDGRVQSVEAAVIGSGVRRSKLVIAGRVLAQWPGAEVIDGLGVE
ncbi:YbaK/EbsC family protein [Nocardioides limicola]|uniref:YbaK/EbsC family protein n=1 Tax=Nocardioides limicola TaxID=2803368 RepID=UPI00193B4494|nr:YbaK/EbsC family protein [Nocardioides sp. DJM-14]